MLCAGAVGNFIDRALYKYVIDFIWIEAINFPVFNVADIYVTVSVLLLVIALLFVYNKDSLFSPKKTNDDLIRKNDPDNTQTDAANQKDENE
jgi:signal peptidase II